MTTTPSPTLRLLSWNVNGLRACLKKGFAETIRAEDPDVLCLQETRLGADQPPELDLPDLPHRTFHSADKPGYAGTALLARTAPLAVETDAAGAALAGEGRLLAAEFADHYVVTAYVPNSQDGLRRLDYRCGVWEPAVRSYLARLADHKPVLYGGDLNVAHREIDIARPANNRRSAGFTDEERAEMDRLLESGFLDSFRVFHPDEPGRYSWWSFRARSRERNVGWRLDYFLVSANARDRLVDAEILDTLHGSDHCPVRVEWRVA